MRRPRDMVGQLLLGELAERAFETIYKETMGTDELKLEDARSSRNETDYRVLNGQPRPVFRINIKFHGTLFRKARDLVSLDPEDCFALATYKIHQGLQKHESERLPYVFVIVSVAGLTGASVAAALPEDLAHLISLVHAAHGINGKRAIEERVVAHLLDAEQSERFRAELDASATRYGQLAGMCSLLVALLPFFATSFSSECSRSASPGSPATIETPSSICTSLRARTSRPCRTSLRAQRSAASHGLAVDLERGVV